MVIKLIEMNFLFYAGILWKNILFYLLLSGTNTKNTTEFNLHADYDLVTKRLHQASSPKLLTPTSNDGISIIHLLCLLGTFSQTKE